MVRILRGIFGKKEKVEPVIEKKIIPEPVIIVPEAIIVKVKKNEMENKPMRSLRILVIEDKIHHIHDVKKVSAELNVSIEIASTYIEAKNMLDNNAYDGVITDVFFPFDQNGWNKEAKETLMEILKEALGFAWESAREYEPGWKNAAEKWISGEEMHPTGALIIRDCLTIGMPVIACTDTYHHGWSTEPVNIYANRNKVHVVDGCSKYDGVSEHKDWNLAFYYAIAEIEYGAKNGREAKEKFPEIEKRINKGR